MASIHTFTPHRGDKIIILKAIIDLEKGYKGRRGSGKGGDRHLSPSA